MISQARIVRLWRLACEDFGNHILTALQRRNSEEKAAEVVRCLDSAADDAGDDVEDGDEPVCGDPPS